MPLLDDAKRDLRLKTTAFDGEITDLIETARAKLILSGVAASKAVDDDPLIKRALILYAKGNFGIDNPDAERYQRAYDALLYHLTLSDEYAPGVV